MDQHLEARAGGSSDRTFGGAEIVEENYLRETLVFLWRRKLIILTTVITLTTIAVIYSFTATPAYTTTLQLLFESKVGPVFDFRAAAEGAPQDEASIISETGVLKSRSVAERVIRKLNLQKDPEFNPELRPESRLQILIAKYVPPAWIGEPSGGTKQKQNDKPAGTEQQFAPPPPAPAASQGADGGSGDEGEAGEAADQTLQSAEWESVVDTFLKKLDVRQVPRSRSVEVAFTSQQPQLAAEALNTLAEMYLLSRLEDRFDNAKRAAGWLAERTEALKLRVEQSEKAVEDYRRRYNLLEGSRETLVSQRISELNGKLTDASIDRRTAEANLASVRRLLSSEDDLATAPQVLQSDLINRFRQNEMDLERREAELNETLGPQHPLMRQIQAERQEVKNKIRGEIAKIAHSLENEAQVARDREAALLKDLQDVKDEMGQANEAAVGLRALEREAQANRLLLEKFLTTFTEASAQEDVKSQLPDARIISRAPVPDDPSFPRKALLIAVAFAGSAVLGVLLAFAAEHLDAGFHSSEEVETEIKLPVIATVPLVKIAGSGKAELAAYATRNPASAFADSIRGIYTHLLLSFKGQPPKTVLFTSSEAGEGKTTVALSFARQQAQAGRRVILVDADFRRSRIGRRAGVALAPGLSELIAGTASIAEATQVDPESPAVLLVAGKQPLMNFAIDDVSRLGALLTELRSEYDVIVIDSPPVLALADARMLSAMADVSLVVVRWGRTPRRVLRFAIRQMTASGGDVHGVVMSMVNIKRQAAYGFGDASYYRGDLTKYYTG